MNTYHILFYSKEGWAKRKPFYTARLYDVVQGDSRIMDEIKRAFYWYAGAELERAEVFLVWGSGPGERMLMSVKHLRDVEKELTSYRESLGLGQS